MAITKDTSSVSGLSIIVDDTNTAIAIDYTPYYERIATALETIAIKTSGIEEHLNVIAIKTSGIEEHLNVNGSSSENFATQLQDINTNLNRIRLLGDNNLSDLEAQGSGFNTTKGLTKVEKAVIYKSLVADGGFEKVGYPVAEDKGAPQDQLTAINENSAAYDSSNLG